MMRLPNDNQATHQKTSSNVFDVHLFLVSFVSLSRRDDNDLSALDHPESRASRSHARKLNQPVVCHNSHF
jgi:hypothetical protein